jgi:tetratricopeptide repeat protein
VNDSHYALLSSLTEAYRAGRYQDAAAIATELLNSAASVSPDEAKEAAQAIVENRKISPIFPSASSAAAAMPFFETLLADLEGHLPIGSVLVAQFALKVAPFYTSQGNPERAAELTERALASFATALGPRHPQTRMARSNLAIHYRNMGRADRADAVFADTGVCLHLRPVQEYIRSLGVRVYDVCTPWSENCRTWVYFENVVLDTESLKSRFNLPDFIVTHSHRGTHDGAEHGLVCQQDCDALMGVHPELAGGARLIG